jgi:uncharacterized protein YqjF (DUF2071 family)
MPGDRWTNPEPPQHVAAPMLFQDWADVVFVHWQCRAADLRPHVPDGLEIQTLEGSAWLSLISFRIPSMRPGGLPPVPGIASGVETHLRTYVRSTDGRGGIWLVSVEFDPAIGAALARGLFWLPYWWSPHTVDTGGPVRYAARRRGTGDVEVDVAVEPGEAVEGTERDHFLTARWILFLRYGPLLMAAPVEHPRWPLRSATLKSFQETVTRRRGLPPPPEGPLVHFSPGVRARIGFPRPVNDGRRS